MWAQWLPRWVLAHPMQRPGHSRAKGPRFLKLDPRLKCGWQSCRLVWISALCMRPATSLVGIRDLPSMWLNTLPPGQGVAQPQAAGLSLGEGVWGQVSSRYLNSQLASNIVDASFRSFA